MNPGTLLIRADANAAIGTGHVMRCLALAQGWQDAGGDVVFAMAATTSAVEQRLAEENCRIARLAAVPGSREDLEATRAVLLAESPSSILLDGYSFDSAFREAIGQSTDSKSLVVDDNGIQDDLSMDLLVNQNVHVSATLYPRSTQQTRLLMGPRYAMLRREFAEYHDSVREIPEMGTKILVTMGGSDPNEFAPRLLPSLVNRLDQRVEICAVIGGSASHAKAMEKLATSFSGRVRILHDVRNMAELMAWADLAIAAAGATCLEMCCLGLPAIVVEAADNQKLLARKLDAMNAAVNAGPVQSADCVELAERARDLLNNQSRRNQLSQNAKRLVDGRGVERILCFLNSELRIRAADARDCRLLWEWANDPVLRAASFQTDPIPWEDHQQWFGWQMASPGARIYIVESETESVGQVRYRIEGGRATLSINLAPRLRGQGLGAKVLLRGVEELFNTTAVETIEAYVKPTNKPSLELFRGAGFEEQNATQIRGQDAVRFVLQRWASSD